MNEYTFDVYSKILSISANLLVLGAVTLSMYMASFQPETHLSAFCSWFFPLLLAIVGLTWGAKRVLRKAYEGSPQGRQALSVAEKA